MSIPRIFFTHEHVIRTLREAEVLIVRSLTEQQAVHQIEVSEQYSFID